MTIERGQRFNDGDLATLERLARLNEAGDGLTTGGGTTSGGNSGCRRALEELREGAAAGILEPATGKEGENGENFSKILEDHVRRSYKS